MSAIPDEHTVDIEEARAIFEAQAPIRVEQDDPLYDWLTLIVNELNRIDTDIDTLFDNRFLATAHGAHLERLAQNVGIDRKTGEGDDKLRQRARAGYAAAVSTGSYEGVARVALLALDASPGEVSLVRTEDTTDDATTVVKTPSNVIDDSPLSESEILAILEDAIIGGHRIEIQRTDVFTWDDSAQGWDTVWGSE